MAGIAYVAAALWLAEFLSRALEWFSGPVVWTPAHATLSTALKLLAVSIPTWFVLVVCDTHSGVTVWPKRWRSLADGFTPWLVACEFAWYLGILRIPETTRMVLAEKNYGLMFGSEGLDWGWYLTFMTITALSEELLVRVLLQRAFEGFMSKYVAVLAQAGVWVLMHACLYGYGFTVGHLLSGVTLGLVFMRTRSLMAPLLVHILLNITIAVLLVRGLGA